MAEVTDKGDFTCKFHMFVLPGETKKLFEGNPGRFQASFGVKAVSEEYVPQINSPWTAISEKEIAEVEAIRVDIVATGATSSTALIDGDDGVVNESDEVSIREAVLRKCIADKKPYVDLGLLPRASSSIHMPGFASVVFQRPEQTRLVACRAGGRLHPLCRRQSVLWQKP